jgi:very-short-patch-repair endonuclease
MKKVIPFEKSFASSYKAKYWHKEKNGDIRPEDITIRTGEKYWFICNNAECGHSFLTSPDKIAGGNWCYYCCVPSNKLCEDMNCAKCLAKTFATHEKAQYWSNKNELPPNRIFKNCNKKFWFDCICGHNFASMLGSINKGSWCPFCCDIPKQLCDKEDCQRCFNNSFASVEKSQYWNYEKNDKVKPRDVFKNMNKKFYFKCGDCKHDFDASLCNVSSHDRWCPYCSRNKLCDDNECQRCFEGSFASHQKSKMWSEKNGELTPRQIARCSGKSYWVKCNDCTHHFQAMISHIVRTDNDKFCPICSSQYMCDDLDCKICFEKSLASLEKSKYYNKELNNGLDPRKIFKNYNGKLWFDCPCGHKFEGVPNAIVRKRWCPYCCNPSIKLCDAADCNSCYEKSFASHPKAKYLDDKTINTRLIFKNTHTKYSFTCEKGHKFQKQISLINLHSGWCPKCLNKTEQKLQETLSKLYNNLIFQYRINWCRNEETNQYLPFDFALEDKKIIIELDGKQHFKQVRDWAFPEDTQKRDKYKMRMANQNGFSVIRLIQLDVLIDTYDWLKELQDNINIIESSGKVQNIFICKNNEYDVYKE